MGNRRASLTFIFVTVLIDVLGFGVVIPVLPKLVTTLAHTTPGGGAHLFGLLLSVYGLMQFLFSPVLGSLSDRFGRRPVLLLSLLFTSVDFLIQAMAPTVAWLFVGRVLAGVTGASFTAASAYISDVTPPERRAQSFGILGAAFGLGFILGPAAGGLLGSISLRAPFWAAAGLSLINCLYGAFILPESLARENRRRVTLRAANPIAGLQVLSRYVWVRNLSVAIALNALAQQALQATWVLYTSYRFHWSALDNGLSLAMVGLAAGLVQAVLIRYVIAALGETRTVIWGLVVNAAGFVGYGLADRGWIMIAIIAVWCLGGVAGPAIQGLISRQYGADEQGAAQGALTSLQSLMGIVGPTLGAWVFGYFTAPSASVRIPGAAFFLAAALAGAAAGLSAIALAERPRSVAAAAAAPVAEG